MPNDSQPTRAAANSGQRCRRATSTAKAQTAAATRTGSDGRALTSSTCPPVGVGSAQRDGAPTGYAFGFNAASADVPANDPTNTAAASTHAAARWSRAIAGAYALSAGTPIDDRRADPLPKSRPVVDSRPRRPGRRGAEAVRHGRND